MDFEISKSYQYTYPTLNYDENRRTLMSSNFQEQSFVVCTDERSVNENLKTALKIRTKLESALNLTLYSTHR